MSRRIQIRFPTFQSASQEEFDDRVDLWVKVFNHQLDALNFAQARSNEDAVRSVEVSLSR